MALKVTFIKDLQKIFQTTRIREALLTSFNETNLTLILKPNQGIRRKEELPEKFLNMDENILKKHGEHIFINKI